MNCRKYDTPVGYVARVQLPFFFIYSGIQAQKTEVEFKAQSNFYTKQIFVKSTADLEEGIGNHFKMVSMEQPVPCDVMSSFTFWASKKKTSQCFKGNRKKEGFSVSKLAISLLLVYLNNSSVAGLGTTCAVLPFL